MVWRSQDSSTVLEGGLSKLGPTLGTHVVSRSGPVIYCLLRFNFTLFPIFTYEKEDDVSGLSSDSGESVPCVRYFGT